MSMQDAARLGHVMLAAWSETQLDLARQQAQRDLVEEAEHDALNGIVSRRYMRHQPDNSRYDGGFWGKTRKGGVRTHNESKAKGFKGWR